MSRKIFVLLIAAASILSIVLNSCGKTQKQGIEKPLYELQKVNDLPKFDAENAYKQIEAQVNFGPRNPGSKGHSETLNYFIGQFRKYADEVQFQSFSYPGYNGTSLQLTNVIAKFNPAAKHRIIFCAHWDTRPRAEHAKDKSKRNEPILGANDGASGCGMLLEIARLLKNKKVNYGIDLVLFDGEDYGKENDLDNFCLGAKYFAANYKIENPPAFCVLLDLVGDKDAVFPKEVNSEKYAPEVVQMIWGIATRLNSNVFSQAEGGAIYDDHIPLNQAGLITVDIIDSELVGADTGVERRNYWHSEFDDMRNIGKGTLQQLGDVLTYLIYSLKFN
jgi:hypothetical protein